MLAVLRRHVGTETGRLALTRALATLHPVEVPSSLRPLAMTVPDAAARARSRRRRPTVALLAGGTFAAAFAICLVGLRGPSAQPTRMLAAAHARREPAPAPPRVKRLAPLEPAAPSSTLGVLQLPPRARGHRVWIDGSPAFEIGDDRVVICGPHTVRIGATGEDRTIQVPCGEVVDVE
jgi:hypothetical protein